MSDAEKVKRLEAQNKVLIQKINLMESIDKSTKVKAEKWEVAKAVIDNVTQMKAQIDGIELDGMNMKHLETISEIQNIFGAFLSEYEGKL